jgi:hypothetical protein
MPKIVREYIESPGFIEALLPSLLIVLASNITNTQWVAACLVELAFSLAIMELPLIIAEENV